MVTCVSFDRRSVIQELRLIISSLVLVFTLTCCKAPNVPVLSSSKDMTYFAFLASQNIHALDILVIGEIKETSIVAVLPPSTDESDLVDGLKATFEVSPTAIVKVNGIVQESGMSVQDFTEPVLYTVLAEDGTSKTYTVFALINDDTAITSFNFLKTHNNSLLTVDVYGSILGTKITLSIPADQHIAPSTPLRPSFTLSDYATIAVNGIPQQSDNDSQIFSDPVIYTVTAKDRETTMEYEVSVVFIESSQAEIISIQFPNINNDSHLPSAEGGEFLISLPSNTAIDNLIPEITASAGATVKRGKQPHSNGASSYDFTNPVVFTVTSEDGVSEVSYTVTIYTEYSLGETGPGGGIIFYADSSNQYDGWDFLEVAPYGWDAPGSADPQLEWWSGSTNFPGISDIPSGIVNNDDYLDYAGMGSDNTHALHAAANSREYAATKSYDYESNHNGVTLTDWFLPSAGELELLHRFWDTHKSGVGTALNLQPALYWSSSELTVGTTANPLAKDFSSFAWDGNQLATTQLYVRPIRYVKKTPSTATVISAFAFTANSNTELAIDVSGHIDAENRSITVEVPKGTDLAALIPTFTASAGATVTVDGIPQQSGSTPQDFQNPPVTYTIRAEDRKTERDYEVSVTVKTNYAIGETGPGGGIVFYQDMNDGFPSWTYLEAAPPDWMPGGDPNAAWGAQEGIPGLAGIESSANLAEELGKGKANTEAIAAQYSGMEYAANLCIGYTGGSKNDWFLPSAEELKLMYQNKDAIGGLKKSHYWSSSPRNHNEAWLVSFNSGNQSTVDKSSAWRVRPIRSF